MNQKMAEAVAKAADRIVNHAELSISLNYLYKIAYSDGLQAAKNAIFDSDLLCGKKWGELVTRSDCHIAIEALQKGDG